MNKISAKQIDGIVDNSSKQEIKGIKTFSSPSNFLSNNSTEFIGMQIDGTYIYWLKFLPIESEGNIRFGINTNNGTLLLQRYESNNWIDIPSI